jgi:biopolymer transport protein TolR
MAFSMAGGGPSRPQINVTPLIDVLLTLIVMFMLVVSMDPEFQAKYQERAQIPNPDQKQSAAEEQSRTIVIEVMWTSKDLPPRVRIDHEEVLWENLDLRLAQIFLPRAEKVAFVRGDADVDFQYVADVIDKAHHAGVNRIGLLTQDRLQGE